MMDAGRFAQNQQLSRGHSGDAGPATARADRPARSSLADTGSLRARFGARASDGTSCQPANERSTGGLSGNQTLLRETKQFKSKLRSLTSLDRDLLADCIRRTPAYQADKFAQMSVEGHLQYVTNGEVAVAMIYQPERSFLHSAVALRASPEPPPNGRDTDNAAERPTMTKKNRN